VKFLIDQNLSPRIAELLTKSGHDSLHVRDLQASNAPDHEIMNLAVAQGRVIVSADTDFGALLAHRRVREPSVVLVRDLVEMPPRDLVDVIVRYLDVLEDHLAAGAIAAFTAKGVRVRGLPIR
jgi:predicted nuclease of predicted toxin-antitoxin system